MIDARCLPLSRARSGLSAPRNLEGRCAHALGLCDADRRSSHPRSLCIGWASCAGADLANLLRELFDMWLQRSRFLVLDRVSKPQNVKIACKIPYIRESAWRLGDQHCVASQAVQWTDMTT